MPSYNHITLNELISELTKLQEKHGNDQILSIGAASGKIMGMSSPFVLRFEGDVCEFIPAYQMDIHHELIAIDAFPMMMCQLADKAWRGSEASLHLSDGKNTIELCGYTYEPSYESFSATSSISLNGQVLYGIDSKNVGAYRNEVYHIGSFTTLDAALKHIKEVCSENFYVVTPERKQHLSDQIRVASSRTAEARASEAAKRIDPEREI